MRLAFLLALLAASLFYSYVAFAELNFLSQSGRLGPGFFPRVIGVALVAFCLICLATDVQRMREDDTSSAYWPTIGVIAVLSGGMIVLFPWIGGTLAMVVFLLAMLSFLNRGHLVLNVAVAVLLPVGIYFLFDVWLNAAMPEGSLPLPI